MRTSDKTEQVMEALRKAALTDPPKASTANITMKSGGQFSYSYANLEDILNQVRPELQKNGLLLLQEATSVDGKPAVATRISHGQSGQWVEVGPLVVPASNDPQAVGSAITYGRRYQLLAVLALAASDDDAVRAGQPDPAAAAVAKIAEPRAATPAGGATAPAAQQAPPIPAGQQGHEGPPAAEPTVGGQAPEGGGAAPQGKADAAPTTPGAPTFDDLRRVTGSAAKARELINRANGVEYNARTIVDVTPAEMKLAWATWQEEGAGA